MISRETAEHYVWGETAAAAALLDEEELVVAVSRLSSLPVKMPAKVIEKFLSLPDEEKSQLWRKSARSLSPVWISPVQPLHLTNLAARSLPSENESILEIAIELFGRLHGEKENAPAAFRVALSFVEDEFHFLAKKLSPEIALAVSWRHTLRGFTMFSAPLEWSREI